MENRSDCTLAGVPRWLEQWNTRKDWRGALLARAALTDACEALLCGAENESRGLNPAEQRDFDLHASQVREINASLAEYRRTRNAGLVAMGISEDESRLPF